jgi:hypothetical protein
MKTTNLICNACRATVTLDGDTAPYGPYGPGPSIVGWYRVQVAELRPTPPRPSLMTAVRGMVAHVPEESREAAERYLGAVESMDESMGYQAPPAMPSQRGADLCPECGPRILASLTPHLIGEREGFATIIGGGGPGA